VQEISIFKTYEWNFKYMIVKISYNFEMKLFVYEDILWFQIPMSD